MERDEAKAKAIGWLKEDIKRFTDDLKLKLEYLGVLQEEVDEVRRKIEIASVAIEILKGDRG